METDQIVVHKRNQHNNDIPENLKSTNQLVQNPQSKTKEELEKEEKVIGVVATTAIMCVTQMVERNTTFDLNTLNIKIINFLRLLGGYSKIKILTNYKTCGSGCRDVRSYEVIGINSSSEENLIMTASQDELVCDSQGYMLIYKSNNNVIFGALGYQFNPYSTCSCGPCNCDCSCKGCCANCCVPTQTKCCCVELCEACCFCCTHCCEGGVVV